jgi:ComF family protein
MHFLDLFFPKFCLGCGRWGRYICDSCREKIKPLSHLKCPVCEKPSIDGMTHPGCTTKYSLDGLTSFYRYDGVIQKAIKHIKYRYTFDIVNDFIAIIPDSSFSIFTQLRTKNHEPKTCFMVPIPLHTSRYNNRGFNQAEIIANALGKRLNMPVNSHVLFRSKKTVPQVEMKDRKKRLANMEHVFAVSNNVPVLRSNDVTILLIDDVFTTGATIRSAASVLKHSGVKFVWGVTIAQ